MLEQIEKTIYKVAIYIRLSKEDVDRGYDESESIKNQRKLLKSIKGIFIMTVKPKNSVLKQIRMLY